MCIRDRHIVTDAPKNSENWFVMINVSHNKGQNWELLVKNAREKIIKKINRFLNTDIEKFIEIKTGDVDMVKYSNISVLLTDEFMDAVQKESDFDLQWGGKVYTTVKAKDLWIKIIEHAHASAEPAVPLPHWS